MGVIIVVIYSMKIFILLCLVSSSFAWPFIPPNMFSNSWFDDWSSWPSFPSFNSFIPSFFQPASGIKMEVLSVTNQSASANCSWYGSGHGNLTWTVDGEEATSDEINDNGTSSVISLEWEKLNKTVGESGGRNNNTGAWLSASQVMETIRVPGENNNKEESAGEENNMVNNNTTNMVNNKTTNMVNKNTTNMANNNVTGEQ